MMSKTRARRAYPYPVVDLFAGPGGLGEGFTSMTAPSDSSRYAFRTAVSIEAEEHAHATLKLRHFYRQFPPQGAPDDYYEYLAGNISKDMLYDAYPEEALAASKSAWRCSLGKEHPATVRRRISSSISAHKKWILVGGPPCQAYSVIGRSRMQYMPEFKRDPRHFLYKEYLKIIADHKPPVFVIENVKGMLSAKVRGDNVINRVLRDLGALGKGVHYNLYSLSEKGLKGVGANPAEFVVKAENYGIPQARHRIFILGVRSDINITPDILSKSPASTVEKVIGNLPKIRSGLSRSSDSYERWRDVIAKVMGQHWYIEGRYNGYAALTKEARAILRALDRAVVMERSDTKYSSIRSPSMKKWLCDDRLKSLSSHESRSHMDSDIHRYFFASLYCSTRKASPKLADFPKQLMPKHHNAYLGRKGNMFSDRFRVQLPDAPSTTITSHIAKDGHYFIHYDPMQCRSLTVREAARLQTFPDNYKFEGPRTAQYQQIGNAVPPLLANKIAAVVFEVLSNID